MRRSVAVAAAIAICPMHTRGQALEATLTASDPITHRQLGIDCAIDGDVIAIGAVSLGPFHKENYVYTFEFNGAGWQQAQKFRAADSYDGDEFGFALDLRHDFLLVGARSHTVTQDFQGAAYMFREQGAGFEEQAKLLAEVPAAFDLLGHAVALSRNEAAVGSINDHAVSFNGGGVVRIYSDDGSGWRQKQRIISPDFTLATFFGEAIAMTDDWLFVGDRRFGDGTVYVYAQEAAGWRFQTRLEPPEPEINGFGQALATDGSTLVVGAPISVVGGQEFAGAAVIYELDGASWVPTRVVPNPWPSRFDAFGSSVAVDGECVAIGSDDSSTENEVLVLRRTAGVWQDFARIRTPDRVTATRFGTSLSLSGHRLAVADPSSHVAGGGAGAVFIYQLDFTECYADCDEDGALDFFDFLCFQNLFAATDPNADCDESGVLDFFDFVCFFDAFAAGCP